jgi:hypothetical protein
VSGLLDASAGVYPARPRKKRKKKLLWRVLEHYQEKGLPVRTAASFLLIS